MAVWEVSGQAPNSREQGPVRSPLSFGNREAFQWLVLQGQRPGRARAGQCGAGQALLRNWGARERVGSNGWVKATLLVGRPP